MADVGAVWTNVEARNCELRIYVVVMVHVAGCVASEGARGRPTVKICMPLGVYD